MMKKLFVIFCTCFVLMLCSGAAAPAESAQPEKIPLNILMYHHITKSAGRLNKYTILESDFESDIVELKNRGYSFILMQDLIDYVETGKGLPEKPIMITFDDGYLSFYQYAYEVLKRQNAKAICSIIGTWAELYSTVPDPNVNYAHMTWKQIAEVNSSPYAEIQNHTYDMHRTKPRKGASRNNGETVAAYRTTLADDIGKLQSVLQQKCGFKPTTFTYPFGYVSEESGQVIQDLGFKASLTCWEGVNYITRDSESLFRLRRYNRPCKINFASFMNRIEKVK